MTRNSREFNSKTGSTFQAVNALVHDDYTIWQAFAQGLKTRVDSVIRFKISNVRL
ncbi:hypothetical protein ABIC45_001241 [Mucilaginibacter rubeus]